MRQSLTRGLNAFTGRFIGRQVFTSTGANTYNPSPGTRIIIAEGVGGGGGGGGADTSAPSGGGAGGGFCSEVINAKDAVAVTATVGAGGAGDTGTGTGTSGGDSTFGSFWTAGGGGGGTGAGTTQAGGVKGSASGGDINIDGQDGGDADLTGTEYAGPGGDSMLGFGYGDVFLSNKGSGLNDGGDFGGGGAGGNADGASGGDGGAGGDGIIIIWEYA